MRLKRTLRTSVVAVLVAVVAAVLGAAPSHAAPGKPDTPATPGTDDQRLLDAEAAAGRAVPQAKPGVQQRAAAIQKRIENIAQRTGNKHTFAAYVDATTSKIVVESDAPADLVAEAVGTLDEQVEVRKRTISSLFSRRDDVAPYWGGAGIRNSTGICSSGYTVKNSVGTRFLVTAGHCFANGTTAVTELGGRVVGTVKGRSLPLRDMEVIGGQSYGTYIYVGGVNSSTGLPVVAAADPVVGFTNYCHSGRTTGENCGHTVVSTSATVCTQVGCQSQVIAFRGGFQPQPGDSGSPFYLKTADGKAHIRGHITAGDGVTTYAEKWSRVAATYGVTIATG